MQITVDHANDTLSLFIDKKLTFLEPSSSASYGSFYTQENLQALAEAYPHLFRWTSKKTLVLAKNAYNHMLEHLSKSMSAQLFIDSKDSVSATFVNEKENTPSSQKKNQPETQKPHPTVAQKKNQVSVQKTQPTVAQKTPQEHPKTKRAALQEIPPTGIEKALVRLRPVVTPVSSSKDLTLLQSQLPAGAERRLVIGSLVPKEGFIGKRPPLVYIAFAKQEILHVFLLDTSWMTSSDTIRFSSKYTSIAHDFYDLQELLKIPDNIAISSPFDLQLATELRSQKVKNSVAEMLSAFAVSMQAPSLSLKVLLSKNADIFKQRPFNADLLAFAQQEARRILAVANFILDDSLNSADVVKVHEASRKRLVALQTASEYKRMILFDPEHSFRRISAELLPEKTFREQAMPLVAETDLSQVLSLIPRKYREPYLSDPEKCGTLRDIILDVGTRPRAFFQQKLVFLSDDEHEVVSKEDLQEAITPILENFGPDNRAGIDGALHRISAIRNKQDEIYGLTIRVGRSVRGNANMILDLLLGSSSSILVMGRPGTGKTTLIREMARILSEVHQNVCVVDTSNEICGDGMVPHKSVGLARRMMVRSLAVQASVMVECVQNHTPDVVIIDEIGRRAEVEAATTVKERGVRVIASAHGDFQSLIKNVQLRGMIGNVSMMTVGDKNCRPTGNPDERPRKTKAERVHDPTFDVIIEMVPNTYDEWRIIHHVSKAVDSILESNGYDYETRIRFKNTGCMYLL